MKITREIKTAILVITAILLFIWGYSFLKGRDLLNDYKTFYVVYDNVEGLTPSAEVTLNGLKIGRVRSIKLDETSGMLLVELQIKTNFPISKSSEASIYEPGFISGKQIAIYPNFSDKSIAVDGDRLIGNVKLGLTATVSKKMIPIQEKLEKIMFNADNLIIGVNNVLDKQGQANLKVSLSELSKTIIEFRKATTNINAILDENKAQVKGVVSNFNKISHDFSEISDSLNKADLGKTVRNLNNTLAKVDGIMSNLESGKGSMGKLLTDEALYKNLTGASKELELLLADLKNNPKRYVHLSVFGRKATPYVAPKNDTILEVKN